MLKNTFLHIPGIGPKKEARMWKAGVQTWDAVIENPGGTHLSPSWLAHVQSASAMSQRHLSDGDVSYFASRLPSSFQWRMFPEFRDATAYLDIETTGLDGAFHDITVIGLYDGNDVHHFIQGENLNDFEEAISKYKVLVTFNGRCFDVPFIEKFFNTKLNHAHIDLRFMLKSLGFRGGLKKCETDMGIDRGHLKGIDGFMAVLLWQHYIETNDQNALETLLAYNTQDIVNLETLLVMAYNMKLKDTPFFESHALPRPSPPTVTFREDLPIIEHIRRNL
jgi:uncharacterized protein YprB with RNaseH-like and TPR domain